MAACSVEGCHRPAKARGWCRGHWKRWRTHGDPLGGRPALPRGLPREAYFWVKVDKDGPLHPVFGRCWSWTGGKNDKGYGNFAIGGGRSVAAHRYVYELEVGPVPAGYEVHHRCENPACVNPAHLEALTRHEHWLISGSLPAQNLVKTHCKYGHALTPENIYDYPGVRMCKTCARERARGRRAVQV